MNHQFFQDFIIPKNLLHDLDRQRTQINLIRVLPIAIIFYVIEWVIFYLSAYFYDVGHIVQRVHSRHIHGEHAVLGREKLDLPLFYLAAAHMRALAKGC